MSQEQNAFVRYFKGDRWIWFPIILLSLVGILAVYSSTGALAFVKKAGRMEYYLVKHTLFILTGFFLMYVFHRIDFRYFSKISQYLIWLALVTLVITIFFGNDINHAKRTLYIPNTKITFQPSDFAKLALVMYLARFFSRKQEQLNDWKTLISPTLIVVATCALILPENLSTALVLFLTSVGLFFISNVRIKHILVLVASFTLFVSISGVLLLKTPETLLPKGRAITWKNRIENYIAGDEADIYQTVQAKIAVANGGITGLGPGKSTQKNSLPHPYSDFIYAIIIEEYGLIGGLIILLAFLLIMFRSIRIVVKSPRAFGALLAVGISFTICLQALIHMGVAVSLLPVTGLTLPLISMGGTSLIFTSLAFGIILSVSRSVEKEQEEQP
jgi:cell division protein FtsW